MTKVTRWPVSMTVRFHLFPFRTQKLSSLVPKIVGWKRPVKIGRCRLLFLLWPVGQAVKTAASHAVNVGSIPARVTDVYKRQVKGAWNTVQPHIIKKARICRESPFTGCSLRFYTACGNNRPPSPLELLSRQNYANLVKVWYAQCRQKKHQNQTNNRQILVLSASDPCGNRTHVNGVRGRCLNRLTNGPY